MTNGVPTNATVLHEHSVENMFREHFAWLTRWVRRQSGCNSRADDVASEVFLRLLTMNNLVAVREPRAMMTTIARRVVIELVRRDRLWRAYEQTQIHLPEQVTCSPEEVLLVKEALMAVDTILAQMSAKGKAAFLMSQLDGLSQVAIAEKLGISPTMARKYIAQGLLRFYMHHPDRSEPRC